MKKNELMRVKNLLENDRNMLKDNFDYLILKDVKNALSEYFEFEENPKLEIFKQKGKYQISINLTAIKVKTFISLPEENL